MHMAMVARGQNPIQHIDKQSVYCSIQIYSHHYIMYTNVRVKQKPSNKGISKVSKSKKQKYLT